MFEPSTPGLSVHLYATSGEHLHICLGHKVPPEAVDRNAKAVNWETVAW